jgi:immune inhibitor InhA-like protein
MRRRPLLALVVLAGLIVLGTSGAGLAAKSEPNVFGTPLDTFEVGPEVQNGTLPIIGVNEASFRRNAASQAAVQAAVGDTRNWLALDNQFGFFYRKGYTLLAVAPNIEVWVATEDNRRAPASTLLPQIGQSSDLNFLDGDCRNGARTQVTTADAQYLADEFSTNMLPKESVAFSVAPARDGSHAQLGPPTFDPTGAGENTVVLVDNVRDSNFYDKDNTQGNSYIAGFFSSQLNTFFDRNIMTIDGFDWLHRTHANPKHEPVPGNNCTSAPARPFLYEGVFAHEYQHLLMSYADPDGESTWINEGLSDWAQTLTGYVNPATPITQIGFDSHTQCFLGWLTDQTDANPNPRLTSGPENSLTRWSDQGDGEILCDYGAAYTFMEYIHGLFGTDFMKVLHNSDANGLAGVQEALSGQSSKLTPEELLHNWSTMVAVDGLIDDGARILGPYNEKLFTAPKLDATIKWNNPHAYDTPGAPSNGADYVALRNASGTFLNGGQIDSLSFQGATTTFKPVQWTVAANPPLAPGDSALFSGAANNRDEAIVRSINVPSGAGATLTFDALWNQELGWDFLFAQISTDGGATYKSLTCTDTTTVTNPQALPTAKNNVPGFTGYPGAWKPQTCSLSAYAGQTVLLAFRTFNDPGTLGENPAVPAGAWVDDVRLGGTLISDGSNLDGWQSFSQVRPNTVAGFTVTILSIETAKGKITVNRLPLTGDFAVRNKANVQKYIEKNADIVAAIVFFDDPAEADTNYARYRLTVNDVVQPGGGM